MGDSGELPMWVVAVRRLLFLTVLLSIGVVSITGFYFAYRYSTSPTTWTPTQPRSIPFFFWGADSVATILAVWLVGRSGVWSSWPGRARAMLYLLAFIYGTMLCSATQVWLYQMPIDRKSDEAVAFRWPGARLDDYGHAVLNLLTLMTLIWLLLPVFTFCRVALADKSLEPDRRSQISLASMIGWVTLGACVLVFIRMLTWESVAPRTYLSSMTPADAATEYVIERLPGHIVVLAATMLMLVASTRQWWLAIVALAGAVLIDGLGHELIHWVLGQIQGRDSGNVLTGPALEKWSYVVGRNFIFWVAIGAARLTGVSFRWR